MDYRRYIIMLSLLTLALTVRAQVGEDKTTVNTRHQQPHVPDSVKNDYEEWLQNEPLPPEREESRTISPLPPSMPLADPRKLKSNQPSVSIVIMTPALRTEMELAYQSHFLEEQQKSQVGGAITIGINPLSLIRYVYHKLFPHRKSKKQREREKLQQILDNY